MSTPNSAKTKRLLIANPKAGSYRLQKKWKKDIEPFLVKTLVHFDYVFTESKDHATELTRLGIQDGYNEIICMGGDGSINEVVNGFFENGHLINPKAKLGILPFGSGGDFTRSLKLSRNYKKCIDPIIRGHTKNIDVGFIEFENKEFKSRYFLNIMDIGVVANIMRKVNTKNKFVPAMIRYVTGSFQGFMKHHNVEVSLRLYPQGKYQVNLTNLLIANGQYFGRGMRPTPHAVLDDGLFDILLAKDLNLARFALNFPQLYTRKKIVSKNFETFQANKIEVTKLDPTQKLFVEMDGETYGEGNVKVSLLPKAIPVLI